MSTTIGQPLATQGVPRRRGLGVGDRSRRWLGNGVMTAVSAAVVAIVVATNTASPWSSAPVAPASFKVALGSLAGVGVENRYLARIGARIRIVPLESRCTPAGLGGRSATPQSPSHRTSGPWIGSVIARQAPSGATTIVLASQGGLDAATFQVRGRVPACLPAIAAVRYW